MICKLYLNSVVKKKKKNNFQQPQATTWSCIPLTELCGLVTSCRACVISPQRDKRLLNEIRGI